MVDFSAFTCDKEGKEKEARWRFYDRYDHLVAGGTRRQPAMVKDRVD
jgi:hypothetical protein